MDNVPAETAQERLGAIAARMDKAEKRFGRMDVAPTLVAVSKTVPSEALLPYLDAGQLVFGENRVQEAAAKWPALRDRYEGIELHLIGPLQTNKAREAVALFDVIETLDRERLAEALAAEMDRADRHLSCFVQVNIGLEPQKTGIAPDQAAAFVERCRSVHKLSIAGLMCIPPADEPPGPYFAHLAALARDAGVSRLSMGMSGDFEVAIMLGATHIRIGSALFGPRKQVGRD